MASKRVYFTGLKRVQANLNNEITKIKGRTKAGLWSAALVVRRRAQQLSPVDTGNLKGSAFTNAYDTPKGPGAEIGFTASYAVFVHEVRAKHKVGQWKFLQTALQEKATQVLEIIKKYAKVN